MSSIQFCPASICFLCESLDTENRPARWILHDLLCCITQFCPRNLQIHKIQRFKNFFLIQTHFFIIFRYISAVQDPFKILCFKLFPVFPDDFILSKLSLAVNCLQCSVQMFYRILYGLFGSFLRLA